MSSQKNDAKEALAKVRAYIASQPPDVRRTLKKIRDAIRSAAPTAVDGFGYGIPSFKLDGRPLIYYAGWKHHVSVYPLTPAIRRAHGEALAKYEVSKGTVRFPLAKPVPLTLVKRLVKTRIQEVRAKNES